MPKLCECGCGEPAPIAKESNRKWGHVKGQPVRFVRGHHQRVHLAEPSALDLAWLAGLLEGEGSFMVGRRTRRPKRSDPWIQLAVIVRVGMTDLDVIEHAAALMGAPTWSADRRAIRRKTLYTTAVSGRNAELLCKWLYPLLGERRRGQIDRALAEVRAARERSS